MGSKNLIIDSDESTLEFRIISWREALEVYRDDIAHLTRSLHLGPTHLPDWLDIIISNRGLAESVQVLLIEDNNQVVGAIPYFVSRQQSFGVSVDVLDLVSNIVSYHAAPITSADFSSVLEYLSATAPDCQVFRVLNLVDESSHSRDLLKFARNNSAHIETLPGEQSPYLQIASDWESFLKGKRKKFRYKLRQREQSVSQDDSLSLETITGSNFRPDLYQMIIDIEEKSWKAKYGLDIATRVDEREYYRQLLPYLAKSNLLHLVMLYKDNQPIAYSLCVFYNRWFGQLKTSFDERFSDFSPGAIVIDGSIRAAFEAEADEFDFLGDTDQHKLTWTKSVRQHSSYFVYLNRPKARLLFFAKRLKRLVFPKQRVAATKPS